MNIEEKAHELADALANSLEIKELRQAEKALGSDEAAQAIIAEFNDKQKDFYDLQMKGQELTEEQKNEAAEMEEKMQSNPSIANYIAKQQDVERLLHAVNLIVAKAISGNDGDCGTECGSECGSECGPSCGCM